VIGPLADGQTVGDRYLIEGFLGEGGMQFVYVAEDQVTGRDVALKTPKNKSATKRFKRGAIVAAKVNHPNVAKTLDYFEIGDEKFLIEELIYGEDLEAAIFKHTMFVDPYLAAKILHHLAKGVAAAHHVDVIHRDLKPTNIMVVGDYSLTQLKITDFGIAKMVAEEQEGAAKGESSMQASQTFVGAIPYMAPEAIETPIISGKPADIWSIGAMMFRVLTGNYPFGTGLKAVPLILAAIRPEVPAFVTGNVQFAPLAKAIVEIIFSCLEKDPAKRPTADQLVFECSQLCYTSQERTRGVIKTFLHGAYGFIRTNSNDVFFHKDSVFGELPKVDDAVIFASYDGGGARRALPVIKLSTKLR
jgi:eukaryotic-like serine/threonine-protein kinase